MSLDDLVLGGSPAATRPADSFEVVGPVGPDGAPLDTTGAAYQRIEMVVRGVSDELLSRLAKAPHLMRELHWRDFEQLIAELFARDGFEVTVTPRSGDRGVDLYAARRTGLGSLLYVVQAKQWAENRPVGPDVVLQLRGAIERDRASAGVIATTSSFTPGARQEQQDLRWRISLQEHDDLRRWLVQRRILGLPLG